MIIQCYKFNDLGLGYDFMTQVQITMNKTLFKFGLGWVSMWEPGIMGYTLIGIDGKQILIDISFEHFDRMMIDFVKWQKDLNEPANDINNEEETDG